MKHLLSLLIPSIAFACGASAVAGPLAWHGRSDIASGHGEKGPWQQNNSRYDYVDDPTVLIDRNGNVGRSHAASGFSAARTVAMRKSYEWGCHLIAHCSAKTTSIELLIRHAASVKFLSWASTLVRTDRAARRPAVADACGT